MSRSIAHPTIAAEVRRLRRLRAAAAALAGSAALVALTGCSSFEFQEDVCSGGEYPVLTVNGSGSACVSDGEQPPAGFVRYPEGKVPRQVDDKWDVYWRTHTLDEDGRVIAAPDAG
ncbi:SCO0607 family lipoprotein [Streptomyces sp. NPDC004393]